jgi:hypothetical protein
MLFELYYINIFEEEDLTCSNALQVTYLSSCRLFVATSGSERA